MLKQAMKSRKTYSRKKRTVEYGDISLEERVVKELMKGPDSDELSTVIPSNVNYWV